MSTRKEAGTSISNLIAVVRGAGELASGIAHQLASCHFRVCLTEIPQPQAVRREISFCEAVYEGEKKVEGLAAKLISSHDEIAQTWREGKLPLLIDPEAGVKGFLKPDVLVDAIIAKRNIGTRISDAPLVIGVGIGFRAGVDAHIVIETNRGHNLGRIITEGCAEPDTGIPGEIGGVTLERVFHTPAAGRFSTNKTIGDRIGAGEAVASVNGVPIYAQISGIIRGLLRDGTTVHKRMKAGDIDPRGIKDYCYTISDKSRTVAGGVVTAIVSRFNL